MQAPRAPVILVIGGGGYLGQFLLEALLPDARDGQWQLHFTQRNSELAVPGATAHAMNLCDEGQIAALLEALRPAVIINTAAMTSLADCEKNPDEASAVNAPEHLFAAAAAAAPAPPLLVQLSTDQVYDGAHAPYAEGDTAAPVNHYGATKLHCEQRMAAAGVNGVVLRSSNILGPPAPFSGAGKFLQWLDGALAAAAQGGDNVTLWDDEYRNFVWVYDICRIVRALALRRTTGDGAGAGGVEVFNMGGPERLSRVNIGSIVCRVRGLDEAAAISPVLRYADGGDGKNAQDLSMKSEKLYALGLELGLEPFTRIEEGLAKCWA